MGEICALARGHKKASVHVADCVDEFFGRDETPFRAADEDAADERTLEVGDADAVLAVAEYPHQVLRRDAVLRIYECRL